MRLTDSIEVPIYASVCGRRIDAVTLTYKDVEQLSQMNPAELRAWVLELRVLFRPPTRNT